MVKKKTAQQFVGSTQEGKERSKGDFYPTPRWATEALLERENFGSTVWECACGKLDISEILIKHKYWTNTS